MLNFLFRKKSVVAELKPFIQKPVALSCLAQQILEDLGDSGSWSFQPSGINRLITYLKYKSRNYILSYNLIWDIENSRYKAYNISLVGLNNSPFTLDEQALLSKSIAIAEKNINKKIKDKEQIIDLKQLKKIFPNCYKKKK